MDLQKLRQTVFEKTGIRIDEVAPVFTIVALNEAAFEDLMLTYQQAHLNAALKAATEAKADIMTAARLAVSAELEKAAAIITNAAHQLANAGDKVKANAQHRWAIAIVQAVIGGTVAGVLVLTALHLKQ